MVEKSIPDIVIGRLPMYLRTLEGMGQKGYLVASSQEMAKKLGISAAQIRKDLSQFGEFGKQGTGYPIEYLVGELRRILHVDREWKVAVVGAGDIGSAIARYKGFTNRGFQVAMIFDNDPQKIGTLVGTFEVQNSANLDGVIKKASIRVAMIATPAAAAQEVANHLIEAGVCAILNYAPTNLTVPAHVNVQYIDPVIHLQRLTYYL
jgi:redox-sensing transcriptional repressor